jgi:general secretion pathway protein D
MKKAAAALAVLLMLVAGSRAMAAPASSSSCRKLPAGRRIVKLSLKPDTDVADLVAWISSITCKQFVLPGTIAAGKKVTIVSPQLLTPEEAYRLFVDALDSVGLALYPSGTILRIVDSAHARTLPVPVYVDGER